MDEVVVDEKNAVFDEVCHDWALHANKEPIVGSICSLVTRAGPKKCPMESLDAGLAL